MVLLPKPGWTDWSDWSTCTVACGGGMQSRSRVCPSRVSYGLYGLYGKCMGLDKETRQCNAQSCPVNGGWSEWSGYGTCSTTCGSGTQSRSRTCTNPAPAYGGAGCSGSGSESQTCNADVRCPVQGGWSDWSSYGTCSTTCGAGTRSRTRTCTNPAPAYGGAACEGSGSESQTCNADVGCPVPGGWSDWSIFGTCTTTCGAGSQTRSRTCTKPPPSNGGADCAGSGSESQACNIDVRCPVPGGWSAWSDYGTCTTTCGAGSQTRTRSCTNPVPAYGGPACEGSGSESQTCNADVRCPVPGGWSTWSDYGTCSTTCGAGTQSRTRTCTNPAPAYGGAACEGSSSESQACNADIKCPVPGGWSEWSTYGTCSTTCGAGSQTRARTCTKPPPSNGGADCSGSGSESQTCNADIQCPVPGGWSDWSSFGTCSTTCGAGSQTRSRTCTKPPPSNGGADCAGPGSESQTCNTDVRCPVPGGWSGWSTYGTCSTSCGKGSQTRSRTCTEPAPANGGADCAGSGSESQACNADVKCPVNGGWSEWTGYVKCSTTCGAGTQSRTRTCTNPSPAYGGADCSGSGSDSQSCNEDIKCPVNGGWSEWSGYGTCSTTCGAGSQTRTRSCTNPKPAYGGDDCSGSALESQACNAGVRCPVDGNWGFWCSWSDWSAWSSERPSTRTRVRSRVCDSPAPAFRGKACVGQSSEQETEKCRKYGYKCSSYY